MSLYDGNGHRKYLTPAERLDFLRAAEATSPKVRTFCGTLAYAGCRISEALALTADRVDVKDGVLVFESLKKRRKGIFRAVPMPPDFLEKLCFVHGLRILHGRPDRGKGVRLWEWSRATAWRRVTEVMETADIVGLHATPKGLRHGFGIKAVTCEVPLNMAQKWLGHARLSTTAIYTNATGPEEKQIAQRMWT
jgi:integrase